ncbi:MAG TPA: ABC transporter substrate-binding protein [Beijerinckiaceae bacterium]|nr:ABC transporter substrate-binding protein [Beijerinckiaceae bacterium]
MAFRRSRFFGVALTASCLAAVLFAHRAPAADLSPAETIYAHLADMPAAERSVAIEAGARKEGAVTIIQTLRSALGDGQIQLFQNRYPFLKVDWTSSLGSPEATERLLAEETAGRHLTDAVNVAILDFADLIRHDLLARYKSPVDDRVLPNYRKFADPQYRWTLTYWSDRGVIYNTNLVPPDKAPKQWMDLCDPFFKRSIEFDSVEARFVAGLYAVMGEKLHDFMKCLGANEPIIVRGQFLTLMLAGDHMVNADSYPYQAIAAQRKDPAAPVGFMNARPIIASFGGVGINRNTIHPYAAALFTDWMLSDESQQYLAKSLRGPIAIKHPYLPDDVDVVAPDLPKSVLDPLVDEWKREVERSK